MLNIFVEFSLYLGWRQSRHSCQYWRRRRSCSGGRRLPARRHPQPGGPGPADGAGEAAGAPPDPRDHGAQRAHRLHHRQGRLQGRGDQVGSETRF